SAAIITLYRCASSPAIFTTLSLHDALPIYRAAFELRKVARSHRLGGLHRLAEARIRLASAIQGAGARRQDALVWRNLLPERLRSDRKSTRLNSSHVKISYAVFCLKKKNKIY